MKLYWIEYMDGIENRDNVVVLNEKEDFVCLGAMEEYTGALLQLGDIYPVHAEAPDGTVYAITLTPVPAEVRP